jgi:hypothetical protein
MLGAGERTSNAYPLAPKGVGEAAKFFFASASSVIFVVVTAD